MRVGTSAGAWTRGRAEPQPALEVTGSYILGTEAKMPRSLENILGEAETLDFIKFHPFNILCADTGHRGTSVSGKS